MTSWIQEIHDHIISVFLFVLGIALAVSLIRITTKYDHNVRKIVNEKPNVYENVNYTEKNATVPGSSVFFEAMEIDRSIEIDINSHILTDEERNEIDKGTIVYLIDNINFKYNYLRTYYYDSDGNVVRIKYKPVF